MAKNIVVFSDGTGQSGGLLPDEDRSNVYKLYRAARSDPESSIDPLKQHTFYDPGLGSDADGGGLKVKVFRWFYNLISKATGFGITRNIAECYAEIIRVYEPGDRIFLFGFSRGAYTVRCLGGVLSLCGIPTELPGGRPLKRDKTSVYKLASQAVKQIYQHGSGRKHERFEQQRRKLAEKFREEHKSGTSDASNVVPHFIGVWDTVASTGLRKQIWALLGLFFLILCALGTLVLYLTLIVLGIDASFTWLLGGLLGIFLLVLVIWIFAVRLRFARGIDESFWSSVHFTGWRMRFYDTKLDPRVKYAKHALSIDENRKDFERVPWSYDFSDANNQCNFEQIWFAGVHSDVGGSYVETESRLSDAALKWMVESATASKKKSEALLVDKSRLQLTPSSTGVQHDEIKNSWLPWESNVREIANDAPLHETVHERFKLAEVLHFDDMKPYRPENLRSHIECKQYYES